MRGAFAAACLLALAACGEREPARVPAPADAAAPAATATVSPEPATPAPVAPVTGAMPSSGAIGYGGFGPARFGGTEEEVRMAWGRELGGLKPDQPGGCYYLMPQPRSPDGYRLAFMFEDQRFVRMDVDVADIEAPGGGRVGMGEKDIQRLYGSRVQVQNHKYVEGGHYLRIPDANGPGVLLFETDAAGRVVGWRIGEPPQVDYVEGCS
ncbi:lectin [Lysobacter panacisoli]|uniref:Lectin n=1 Tax=Lysobacter panacisoli TaxID=1255263 RepID=A0ABP9L3N3_9GAMM|nr:lectin [Lysobacter panacisoli]